MTNPQAPVVSGQVPASGDNGGQVPPSTPVAPPATGQVPAPGASADDQLTPEQLRDALRKAREDGAKRRVDEKRLADLEKAEQDRQAASLTDQQKAAQRADAAEVALKTARARIGASELKVAAQSAGIIDPDIAAAMLGAKVEYDAAGEPTNVGDLVKQLKTDKPHLFALAQAGQQQSQQQQQRPPVGSGGATNPGQAGGAGAAAGGSWTREQINRMSPEEFNRNRTAIFEAMNKGLIK